MKSQRDATLASLRATIARMEGRPATARRAAPRRPPEPTSLPTGIPVLDDRFGGWPRPGITEITGPAGSGRFSLALPALGALTRAGRPAAVVDPHEVLHPPGLPAINLQKLLVIRPGPSPRGAWAAEQLLASGVFRLVVGLDLPGAGAGARKLRQAASRGNCALVLIARWTEERLPAALRLEVTGRSPGGIALIVRRHQGGRGGGAIVVPAGFIAPGMIR